MLSSLPLRDGVPVIVGLDLSRACKGWQIPAGLYVDARSTPNANERARYWAKALGMLDAFD